MKKETELEWQRRRNKRLLLKVPKRGMVVLPEWIASETDAAEEISKKCDLIHDAFGDVPGVSIGCHATLS